MIFQNFLSNLTTWVFVHGIKVGAILIGAFVVCRMVKVFISKYLRASLERGLKFKEVKIEVEEKRLKTLQDVSYSIFKTVIWLIAVVTILPEVGVNIGPFLASIGVVGLALGLGARSLIQDYLSGIFLLLEDQYRVGEEIEIAGKKGKVKDFNLRRTVIEDTEGTLHYIPNSQIRTASNFSRK